MNRKKGCKLYGYKNKIHLKNYHHKINQQIKYNHSILNLGRFVF